MTEYLGKRYVKIVYGDHAGRAGYVVSTPWLGNLFHLLLTVNVAGKRSGWGGLTRDWVTVWRWEVADADAPRFK